MTQPEIHGPPVPDDESLAYEAAAVAAVVGPVAALVAAVLASAAVLLAGGAAGMVLSAALARRLRSIPVPDMSGVLRVRTDGAVDLGVRTALADLGQPDMDVPVSAPVARPDSLESVVRTKLGEAADIAASRPLESKADLEAVSGRARTGIARAEAATRYAVNHGINSGTADVARAAGLRLLWVAERNACLDCLAYAGWAVEPDDEFPAGLTYDPAGPLRSFGPLYWPPLHPNCFPAGSIVSGPGVRATFKRWYEGEMVEIRTRSGRVLSGTPNHPVLTDQGWVGLGGLVEGSHVVGNRALDRMLASDPHDYQRPARIEDVARTLGSAARVPVISVPMTPEDFHGDGTDGNVHVVWPDGALRNGGQVAQPFGYQEFGGRRADLPVLSGQGAARQSLDAIALTAPGIVSGGSEPGPFGRVGAGHAGGHGGGPVAQLYTGPGQESRESGAADLALFRERLDALSGLVSLDQVVSVRRYPFAGHVFNLETSGGWYICNGITVHNCRCRVRTYTGAAGPPERDRSSVDPAARLASEAQRAVVYQWSDYASGAAAQRAARALLDQGTTLADSVERRAAAALRKGRTVRRPR